MSKKWTILLVLAAILITDLAFSQGCSQCKLVAEQGAENDRGSYSSNINFGILYLMAIPYLLIMFLFRKKIYEFFKKKFGKKSAPTH